MKILPNSTDDNNKHVIWLVNCGYSPKDGDISVTPEYNSRFRMVNVAPPDNTVVRNKNGFYVLENYREPIERLNESYKYCNKPFELTESQYQDIKDWTADKGLIAFKHQERGNCVLKHE